MATYYVDSNATGLDDGSSWTDAWTSITSATSVSAGDTVLLASDHVENETGTSLIINYAAFSAQKAKLISTNKTTGVYEAGALINLSGTSNTSDIYVQGAIAVHGVTFRRNRYMYFGNDTRSTLSFYNCTFDYNSFTAAIGRTYYTGTGNQNGNQIIFESCTFDNTYGNANSYIQLNPCMEIIFTELNVIPASGQSIIFASGVSAAKVGYSLVSCSDLSSLSSLSLISSTNELELSLVDCELPSSWISASSYVPSTSQIGKLSVFNCQSNSSGTAITGFNREDTCNGQSFNSYTEYRSSGANDSTDDFSYEMTTNASPLSEEDFIESIPITKYVQSGSQTITVYIAGGASLNNDDFWIEVESPSELASPTAQGKFRTTKPDPLATPTALTSDTSSWTGTGVGTAQKVEVAISPTIAGTVTVRCYLAKPSTTVYVDPKISTDGYQRVFNGVLVDGDAVGGGGGAVLHPLRSN